MSTTTVTASELENILLDYKIHLTGDDSTSRTSIQEARRTSIPIHQNPENWPRDHRRVPDYRPVDKNRDAEGRPNGSNPFERGFLTVMFTGVLLNATAAKVWGATGGRYFPRLFRYAIGGEW